MKVTKIRSVKTPTRANKTDAGIDFFVPEFDEEFIDALKEKNTNNKYVMYGNAIKVNPHEGVLIPSGVRVVVPSGHALVAFNKSGVAVKQQLVVGACVVDDGYVGEVHINVINTTNRVQDITSGMKLAQFVILPINSEDIELIGNEEYSAYENTDRGAGGFGSTGSH